MSDFPNVSWVHLEETVEALALGLCESNSLLHLLLRADGQREDYSQGGVSIHLVFERVPESERVIKGRSLPMSVYVYVDHGTSIFEAENLFLYPVCLENSEDWPEQISSIISKAIAEATLVSSTLSIVQAKIMQGADAQDGTDTKDSSRDMYKVRSVKATKTVVTDYVPSPISIGATHNSSLENPKSTVQIECAPDLT